MTIIMNKLGDLGLPAIKSIKAVKSMFYRTKEKVETEDMLKKIEDLETEISNVKLNLRKIKEKLEAEQLNNAKVINKTKLDSELANEVTIAKREVKTLLLNKLGELRKKINAVIATYMEAPPTAPLHS
ncbi:hypothetical protein P8452_09962 [Trifolium repens]|nr:hypothetical protein P8452_09962 [Trifolium repens]